MKVQYNLDTFIIYLEFSDFTIVEQNYVLKGYLKDKTYHIHMASLPPLEKRYNYP